MSLNKFLIVLGVYIALVSCGPVEKRVPITLSIKQTAANIKPSNFCTLGTGFGSPYFIGSINAVAYYPDGTSDVIPISGAGFDIYEFDNGSNVINSLNFSGANMTFSVKAQTGVSVGIAGVVYRHYDKTNAVMGVTPTNGWTVADVVGPAGSNIACTRTGATPGMSSWGSTDSMYYPIVIQGLAPPTNINQANQAIVVNNVEFFRTSQGFTGDGTTGPDSSSGSNPNSANFTADDVRGFDGFVYLSNQASGSRVPAQGGSFRNPKILSTNTTFSSVRLRILGSATASSSGPIQVAFIDNNNAGLPPQSTGWLPFPCPYHLGGLNGATLMNASSFCAAHSFYAFNLFRPASIDKVANIWPLFPNRNYDVVLASYTAQDAPFDSYAKSEVELARIKIQTRVGQTTCIVCDVRSQTVMNRYGIDFSGGACVHSPGLTKQSPTVGQCYRSEMVNFAVAANPCQIDTSGGACGITP